MKNAMTREEQDLNPLGQGSLAWPAVPVATDSATATLLHTVQRWTAHGWLRSLDEALVLFLHELDPAASPLVLLAAALASHQLGRGHVCLDLRATLANSRFALSLPPDAADHGLEQFGLSPGELGRAGRQRFRVGDEPRPRLLRGAALACQLDQRRDRRRA